MRVLVTGALNPSGMAVARALAKAGHTVRAFGVPAGTDPFHDPQVECFPGDMAIGGSVEPVASECKAIVHCAPLDDGATAFQVERGTLYARYAAERELVQAFVVMVPVEVPRRLRSAFDEAEAHVAATRALVPRSVVRVAGPEQAAEAAVKALRDVQVAA